MDVAHMKLNWKVLHTFLFMITLLILKWPGMYGGSTYAFYKEMYAGGLLCIVGVTFSHNLRFEYKYKLKHIRII